MPKDIVEELEEDDLEAFTGEARQKLFQIKKVWNDERREKDSARKILNQLIKKYQEKITFFHSQSEKQKAFYRMEIYREIEIYRSLLLLAQENGDLEFYNSQRIKFNNFNNMMGEYKREIE